MCTVRESNKARHIRISIYPGGEVVVTIPKNTPRNIVEKFLHSKADWIEKKVLLMKRYPKTTRLVLSKKEVSQLKQKAYEFVEKRLLYFNTTYNQVWKSISIRGQKTRWGSCSQKGNLHFNYKIALLPEDLGDYVVVHELCHLKEFNHSRRFWDLVSQAIPDYREKREKLRKIGLTLQ